MDKTMTFRFFLTQGVYSISTSCEHG